MFNYLTFTKPLHFIAAFAITISLPATANDKMTQELIDRISSSKAGLIKVEADINQQTTAYARKINKQQLEVKQLRKKAAVLQRVADEQLMSVDQLEKRVNMWATQSNYQKQILTSFAESSNLPIASLKHVDGEPVVDIQSAVK